MHVLLLHKIHVQFIFVDFKQLYDVGVVLISLIIKGRITNVLRALISLMNLSNLLIFSLAISLIALFIPLKSKISQFTSLLVLCKENFAIGSLSQLLFKDIELIDVCGLAWDEELSLDDQFIQDLLNVELFLKLLEVFQSFWISSFARASFVLAQLKVLIIIHELNIIIREVAARKLQYVVL